jgi:hypothetical protein
MALLLAACGGASPRRPAAPKPRLVEGEGAYVLRYNPPRCLSTPDLFFEVQTPLGWERVALENADEEAELVDALAAEASVRPEALPYGGDHAARVLRVQAAGAEDEEQTEGEPPADEAG